MAMVIKRVNKQGKVTVYLKFNLCFCWCILLLLLGSCISEQSRIHRIWSQYMFENPCQTVITIIIWSTEWSPSKARRSWDEEVSSISTWFRQSSSETSLEGWTLPVLVVDIQIKYKLYVMHPRFDWYFDLRHCILYCNSKTSHHFMAHWPAPRPSLRRCQLLSWRLASRRNSGEQVFM